MLKQSFTNFEIILMDDCSSDNSRIIIDEYKANDDRISVVYNEQNSGSTFKQWNKGFALARGEYVWIAESDDYAEPELLRTLLSKLESDSSIGLAYCNSAFVDEFDSPLGIENKFYLELDPVLWSKDFVLNGDYLVKTYMSFQNIIPNASAVLVRRKLLLEVDKADESFKVNGDWVFWASIFVRCNVAFVAQKLNYFRLHMNNARSKINKGLAVSEMTKVVRTMKKYGEPNPYFLLKMIDKLHGLWFESMVANNISIENSKIIYNNLKYFDLNFRQNFFRFFKKYVLSDKLSGARQYLGDGLFYKYFKKEESRL
ncbi:MAG: glycosyltransferase family 2 protein [Hymenobacter sp.]